MNMINAALMHASLLAERLDLLLWDAAIKSVLLFAIAGGVAFALRRSSPANRHLVWLLFLIGAISLPIFAALAPEHEVKAVSRAVQIHYGHVAAPTAAPLIPPPRQKRVMASVNGRPAPAAVTQNLAAGVSDPQLEIPRSMIKSLIGIFALGVLAFWLIGAVIAASPLFFSLFRLTMLTRTLAPLSIAQSQIANDVASSIAPGRVVRIRLAPSTSAVRVPMTWGYWHPIIALPADARDWPEARLCAALLHELAHARRGDWLVQLIASLACSLYWLNPLVWIGARMMRTECENAADDFVTTHGVDAPSYAQHLLEIALALRGSRARGIALPMARHPRIENRLRQILQPHSRQEVSSRRRAVALSLAACALLTVSAFRFSESVAGNAPGASSPPTVSAIVAVHPTRAVTLPNGAVVRLIAVGDTQAGAYPPLWIANGAPARTMLPKNTLDFPNLPRGVVGRLFAVSVAYASGAQPCVIWAGQPNIAYNMRAALQRPGAYYQEPDETWEFVPDEHIVDLSRYQPSESRQGHTITDLMLIPQAFRASVQACTVKIGVATSPWTETVACPKEAGKTFIQTPSGQVIFTLIPNPHHLKSKRAIEQGDAVFMVSDHLGLSRYPPATVVALDRAGRAVYEFPCGTNPDGYGKVMMTSDIPNALLSRVSAFRLSARRYQWAEFRNVRLEPSR